jgi:hypothetical protein
MPRELSALIGLANRQAYFINGVYLRCVVVAGICMRGVSGAGLYTLRYVTGTPVGEPARDGGVSGCSYFGCAGLFASRLAPTGKLLYIFRPPFAW